MSVTSKKRIAVLVKAILKANNVIRHAEKELSEAIEYYHNLIPPRWSIEWSIIKQTYENSGEIPLERFAQRMLKDLQPLKDSFEECKNATRSYKEFR
jgi:hypothetical protein